MVVKNLLPIYHKYLFGQYFSNFKALIDARTQITINNRTIKNEDAPKLIGVIISIMQFQI